MNLNRYTSLFFIYQYFVVVLYSTSSAQPSGGPYGPIPQTYELSKAGTIYYAAPDGNADNSGESIDKPTTIESAIERVKTGDAIILRGGTYRIGDLVLNQGIAIQPYKDEQPVLKGTFVANEWKSIGNGLWTTKWDHLFPSKPADWWRRYREGKFTPLHRFNNDMVFVNGKFLQSAGWEGEVDENSYYIDYDSKLVYIGTDPKDKLIEITAFDAALVRTTKEVHGKASDGKGPVIRGITFTQYAYRALEIEGKEPEGISPESEHGKDVTGTLLENCTISFCSRVAGYLRGDNLTIRNCKVSDTSTEGIYIIASSDVLLENNIFTRNNIEKITGYYPAAVKIFNQSYRVTCRNNLVIDHPYSNGIWYDVGNVDGVFINNRVERVGLISEKINYDQVFPSQNGFFFEISKGAVCAGNLFVDCDHGLMVLNSSDVHIYNNTFVNSMAVIARTARSARGDHFGWHPATGPDVEQRFGHIFMNNLLTADENFNLPLFFAWQPDSLCGRITSQQLSRVDNNVFVRSSEVNEPLIIWSPANGSKCRIELNSPGELNKLYSQFSANSKYFSNYNGQLFKSRLLGNYELLPGFPGSNSASELPSDIIKLIGLPGKYVGAFPYSK